VRPCAVRHPRAGEGRGGRVSCPRRGALALEKASGERAVGNVMMDVRVRKCCFFLEKR
jgi:hypothetical protein